MWFRVPCLKDKRGRIYTVNLYTSRSALMRDAVRLQFSEASVEPAAATVPSIRGGNNRISSST